MARQRHAVSERCGGVVNLGTALEHRGEPADAASAYQQCLAQQTDDPGTYYRYGNALLTLHRADEAIKEYQAALKLDPKLAEAHNNLGVALQKVEGDHLHEAEAEYQAAIDIVPNYVNAWQNLGRALESERIAACMPPIKAPNPGGLSRSSNTTTLGAGTCRMLFHQSVRSE